MMQNAADQDSSQPKAYPPIVRFTRACICLAALTAAFAANASGQVADEPWLMYRGMALDDLRLALGRIDLRLDTLRVEAARSKKLVEAGAAPAMELTETQGALAIAAAERAELVGLIRWMSYLKTLEDKNREFSEEEHFRLFLGHLEPRVRLAESVTALLARRHAVNERLAQRRAVATEEFERSADALAEAKARERFYKAQAAAARLALDVREGKQTYREEDAQVLAEVVRQTRIDIWTVALEGAQRRLSRLTALKARGLASQAEIDAGDETLKTIRQAKQEAEGTRAEPYPPPGKIKRPEIRLVDRRKPEEAHPILSGVSYRPPCGLNRDT
jgi:hypothetical protein